MACRHEQERHRASSREDRERAEGHGLRAGRTVDGRPFRMLVVLGEYTRECLAIEVYRRMWGEEIGTGALHIDPGSPWQTGIVASFNGRLRNELLSSAILDTLVEARHLIDRWRPFYNYRRIPRARGEVIPATFVAKRAAPHPLRLNAHARGIYQSTTLARGLR